VHPEAVEENKKLEFKGPEWKSTKKSSREGKIKLAEMFLIHLKKITLINHLNILHRESVSPG
jgi:hypothetical protein